MLYVCTHATSRKYTANVDRFAVRKWFRMYILMIANRLLWYFDGTPTRR